MPVFSLEEYLEPLNPKFRAALEERGHADLATRFGFAQAKLQEVLANLDDIIGEMNGLMEDWTPKSRQPTNNLAEVVAALERAA